MSDYASPDSFGLGDAAIQQAVAAALASQLAAFFPVSFALPCFDTAAPAGWIFLTGQATPADAPELLAHYGATLPDMRGRTVVGVGPHADVDTLYDDDGLPAASRTPLHNSSVHEVPHTHGTPNVDAFNHNPSSGNVGAPGGSGDRNLVNVNGTGGGATGLTVGPGGVRPTDVVPYKAGNWAVPYR